MKLVIKFKSSRHVWPQNENNGLEVFFSLFTEAVTAIIVFAIIKSGLRSFKDVQVLTIITCEPFSF